MFRYELVNSSRKFIIVVEIVSLLKKICKRDDPFKALFKVYMPFVFQFLQQFRHYESNLQIFKLDPSNANKILGDLVMFISQV